MNTKLLRILGKRGRITIARNLNIKVKAIKEHEIEKILLQ